MLKNLKLRERVREVAQRYPKVLETHSSRLLTIKLDRWTTHTHAMKKLHDKKLAKYKRDWLKD